MSTTARPTNLRWMIPVWAVALLFAVMLGIGLAYPNSSTATAATAVASAPDAAQSSALLPGSDNPESLDRPGTPLGDVLNSDGTLSLRAGFSGSFDPSGWAMVSGAGEPPRFARAAGVDLGSPAQSGPSNQSPAVEGGEGGETWDDRFGPTGQGMNARIQALAMADNGDVYAGGDFTTAGGVSANYIARWDGSAWHPLGTGLNDVVLVIRIADNGDLYVGGGFTMAGGVSANYIARWDGTTWHPLGTGLNSSTWWAMAIADNGDVYVGGAFTTAGGVSANYIARWDGTTWSPLGTGMDDWVFAVAIASNGDVYAGGVFATAGGVSANYIARWDGTTWSPLGPGMNNWVEALAIADNGDVYAGGDFTTAGGVSANYIARWDGGGWFPLGTGLTSWVFAVAIASNGDLYVGGAFTVAGGVSARRIARWDGGGWFPLGTGLNNWVQAVGVASNGDVYAGGDFTTAGGLPSYYIGRYYLIQATATPLPPTGTPVQPTSTSVLPTTTGTPTSTSTATPLPPTGTPVQPTSTSVPPTTTGTPTSTSTATLLPPTTTATSVPPTVEPCTITFTDVPPDHTFYQFVRCLACRGILGGYADNTFRPNNEVTRGQLSKIVSNAAGFSEPQPTQHFEDVPIGSTFHLYVGRLASRGYIGGYPCGGVGEPCGSGNLPYFRPNDNATRGQISKIVSNAAGFNEPAGAQLFEDVAPGSTFYDYIQRLASRGIINGYPCGGAGEPCGGGNLPYFRPNYNATRGQTAKIVANTFFPGCQTPDRR